MKTAPDLSFDEISRAAKKHGWHPTRTQLQAFQVKVVRTCPRCHVRAYHFGNDMGIPHRICCVNCGHAWTGRILKDEQK